MGLVINALIEEGIGISDGLTVQAEMYPVLAESFDLLSDFKTDEKLNITLALDTEQLAPSVHSMIAFNSFAEIDGEVYAAGDAGIYKLSGDTDDGAAIHSGMVWGKISFGKVNKKKLRAVFLEGEIDSTQMFAETNSGSATYSVSRNRISVGRNLIGRDWELRLSDFDRLEAVELAFILRNR